MAVTAVVRRNRTQVASRGGSTEFCTATLSGTYNTGGFQFTAGVGAGPGSSAEVGNNVLDVVWRSPTGYTYVSTWVRTGFVTTVTTKIFTAPGTELANNTAVPDATLPVILYKSRD